MTRSILNAKLKVVIPTSSPLAAAIEGKATAVLPAILTSTSVNTLQARIFADPPLSGLKLTPESVTKFAINFVFSNEFFNTATLYYALDPITNSHLKTLKKKHRASVDNFGIERDRVFYSDGIGSDRVANFYLDDLLAHHAIPGYLVSFVYSGPRGDVELGNKFRLDASYAPGPDGAWTDAVCTVLSSKRRGGNIVIKAVSNGNWNVPTRIVTVAQSSSKSGGGVILDSVSGETVLTIREAGAGSPVIPGIRVEINSIVKITDGVGQVSFSLDPGSYTVLIQGTGYLATSWPITVE